MNNALDLVAPVDTLAMDYTRDFDAPVAALFRAHAEPDLVRQWLGPHGVEISLERWDFRTGGGYRYLHSDENGSYAFNGVFHRVREDLVIQTFEFEGAPDMVNIEFLWFEDLGDGRSRLRGRSICPNTDARDALLSSGMEGGMTEGYERLDALLPSLHSSRSPNSH
ncbi:MULTISPECIES: SRPBCC family protein [Mycolicibacterium]|uniref:SRPBCC family protein n=1 Tax=Mycolicibacterium monacense TaxID=85693 RepID=UPI0007EA3C9F|nr:SRPBCC family protein [Mycolicibacterium monacense]OBB76394.1 polyketide cyclase [Mycolicibacterium monacense]OBF48533.1 polyketide cyclase [Mycolicibacterium monacense]